MSYTIGQKRHTGSGCLSDIAVNSVSQVTTSNGYKDFSLSVSNSFNAKTDYYLHLEIPRDINYDMTFNLKLCKDGDTSKYQFLRQVDVYKAVGDASNVKTVILYADNNGITKVDILQTNEKTDGGTKNLCTNPSATDAVADRIYYNNSGSTERYYLGQTNGTYKETISYNVANMMETWKSGHSSTFGYVDLIFRPVQDDFNTIVVEMSRNTLDASIQRMATDDNGSATTEKGRVVDISDVSYSIRTLTDIAAQVFGTNSKASLTKIGVWSHQGLMMSINGEEIHVGPSGYYEEDAVPVTSMGIAAIDGYRDNWTLDYVMDNGDE